MWFLVFAFGLIIGSFLNACIHRLASGESIFGKSSKCPKCGHNLAWVDLVPVISFFVLGRRCRYCAAPISWQYPLVELATAGAFALVYLYFGISPIAYYLLLTTCFLIVIFVYDLKHYLILDKVVFPAAVLAAGYQIYSGNFLNAALGAVILSGFFAVLYFVSRGRWIGFGDVKLGVFLGFLIPWPATLALFFLAYLSGAAVSVFLVLSGKKRFSSRLPFGTFLTFAAFVAMLWGEGMVRWYFRLIGVS